MEESHGTRKKRKIIDDGLGARIVHITNQG
jgi:hypothetical protein